MKQINVEITGKTPLLLHRFTEEQQENATTGNRLSLKGDRGTPREQATQCLYTNEEGEIILPQPNLFRSIVDAGKFFKNGKNKVTTQKSSLIPALVEMDEVYYPIEFDEDWDVDTRPVRIPSTGGRILRHRPCFNKWRINFSMVVDEKEMSTSMLRDIVDAAGKKIGLGDFRPDCKGIFGKFVVTKWKEVTL